MFHYFLMNSNFDINAFHQIEAQHYQDYDNVPEINEEEVEEVSIQ